MRTPARTLRSERSLRGVAAVVTGITATCLIAMPGVAAPVPSTDPVTRWAERHAVAIPDTGRPGPDLAYLARATRDAGIVGLGESAHELAELTDLKRRAVQFLVEKRGFRSIAWEEDWSLGTQIDDYIHGRRADLDDLVAQMTTGHTREMADVLAWLRGYNRAHDDKVSFFGVEYFATRRLSYGTVRSYVADHAPRRLPEVRRLLRRIYPNSADPGEHLAWYLEKVDDKRPYVRAARRLREVVASIPHRPGDRRFQIVLHHATQIRSWYAAFAQPYDQVAAYRDARAAENVRWAHRFSGDRMVYWAATAHTSDAPDLTITEQGQPDTTFASTGSFLDDWYRDRYVTVGYTFDRGTTTSDEGDSVAMPPAADDWFEAPLGDVDEDRFLLDLDRPVPKAVRSWLDSPMLTRGFQESGYASEASGSTPADWYDVIVHTQEVSPGEPVS